MTKTVKLTPAVLRQLVKEEKEKFLAEKSGATSASEELDAPKPEEVDADEYADTLEKKVDHLAALKIKEAKLVAELDRVRKVQKKIRESVLRENKPKEAARAKPSKAAKSA